MPDFSRGRARQPKPAHRSRHDAHQSARHKLREMRQRRGDHAGRIAAGRLAANNRSSRGPDLRKLAFAVLRALRPGDLLEPVIEDELRRRDLDLALALRLSPMLEDAVRFALLFDHLISHVATRPTADLDADVRAALHLFLTWFLLDDPRAVYAHGQAAVDLLSLRHTARGFVNACCRRLGELLKVEQAPADDYRALAENPTPPQFWRERCRLGAGRMLCAERAIFSDFAHDPASHLAQTCALPRGFVTRLIGQHGLNAACLCALASIERPLTWLRANGLKHSPETLRHVLELRGVKAVLEGGAVALPPETHDFGALGIFENGLAYAQDFSAQQVAPALAPRAGESILDMCAAPGGKAGHLAELTNDRAKILAVDISLEKVARIQENLARLGYASLATAAADAASIRFPAPFDRVLLDAPCSNSGVLARRVEARHRLTQDKLAELCSLQTRMLANAAANLKPGGTLVYSVCSVLMEESVDIVRAFLAAHAEGSAQTREQAGWTIEQERIILPVPARHDGAYFCRLRAPG